jgi:predicted metallo-beta-lactamase superfamily hydrolase
MRPVPIGDGGLRLLPLAYESLGVRGMATLVETDDIKLIIDPGSALGPRFRLNPHEREYEALSRTRRAILDAASDADVLTISHYHFDHYLPNFENWMWIWSSPELARELYSNKLILAKDISADINPSQRKRGYMFKKLNLETAKDIQIADGRSFKFGDTVLEFSKPVYHGPVGSRLGFVLMLTVYTAGSRILHAPDVQGPMYDEALQLILVKKPDAVLMGGPPLYLGFKLEKEELATAQRNLMILARHVPVLVVDHHLLRSLDYPQYLEPVIRAAEERGNRVVTAAELLGREPELLEARRRELHAQEPMEREWYKRLERGEFKFGL